MVGNKLIQAVDETSPALEIRLKLVGKVSKQKLASGEEVHLPYVYFQNCLFLMKQSP